MSYTTLWLCHQAKQNEKWTFCKSYEGCSIVWKVINLLGYPIADTEIYECLHRKPSQLLLTMAGPTIVKI